MKMAILKCLLCRSFILQGISMGGCLWLEATCAVEVLLFYMASEFEEVLTRIGDIAPTWSDVRRDGRRCNVLGNVPCSMLSRSTVEVRAVASRLELACECAGSPSLSSSGTTLSCVASVAKISGLSTSVISSSDTRPSGSIVAAEAAAGAAARTDTV